MTSFESESIPLACIRFMEFLGSRPNCWAAEVDTPEELRLSDVLIYCESAGLIQRGRDAQGDPTTRRIRNDRGCRWTLSDLGKAALAEHRLRRFGASEPIAPNPSSAPTPQQTARELKQDRWAAFRCGGMPLRGWASICEELGVPSSTSKQRELKRLNELSEGPIKWCGKTPEVDAGELQAWISDTEGRSDAMNRKSLDQHAAADELAERDGVRAADHASHIEKRPNARGRAGPAPSERPKPRGRSRPN